MPNLHEFLQYRDELEPSGDRTHSESCWQWHRACLDEIIIRLLRSELEDEAEVVFTKHEDGTITYRVERGGFWLRFGVELIPDLVNNYNELHRLKAPVRCDCGRGDIQPPPVSPMSHGDECSYKIAYQEFLRRVR